MLFALLSGCSGDPAEALDSSSSSEPPPESSSESGGATAEGSGGLSNLTGGSDGLSTGGASGGALLGSGGGGTLPQSGGSGGITTVPPGLETEVTIEEDSLGFCALDGIIETTNAGFSGTGYANTDNAMGAGVRWRIQVGDAGTYNLEISYSNGSAVNRPGEVIVDGTPISETLTFPATADWTTWETVNIDVSLGSGVHDLNIVATSGDGLANLDSLTIRGAAVGPTECSSENGTGGADSGTGGADSGTGGEGMGTGGAAELPDITVYVAGDSTVSTYSDTPSPNDQAGWGQMLHEIFDERVTVQNRAMGGRTARWFHLEGAAQWILDRILPGDYWFVQFGTNDSHPSATFVVDGVEYPRFADAQTAFKEHLLDYYIMPARQKDAHPVLVTPPPRNSAYCGTGNSLGGYAQAMRELAAAEDVLLLDLNQRTFDHLAAICPSPTPEDFFFVRADNSVDGTHFQENGARHMAGFLGDEMLENSIGPYPYLLP